MKNLRRIISIMLVGVLAFTLVSCNTNVDFKSQTKKVGVDRFLDTDWGMTLEQTLKSLGLKEDDVEKLKTEVGNEASRISSYEVKKKIKINGLEGKVKLDFYDKLSNVFDEVKADEKDNYVGLSRVTVKFNEKDFDTVLKAYKKELGDEKYWDKGFIKEGPTVFKGKISEIKNQAIKDKYLNIFDFNGDEIFEKSLNNSSLYSLTVADVSQISEIEGISQIVEYNGTQMAILNNLYK